LERLITPVIAAANSIAALIAALGIGRARHQRRHRF
jgi:hypothetical protein